MTQLRNDDKRLSIDGEKSIFPVKVKFSNLRHPQICIEDNFSKLRGGNLFAKLQTLLTTWFAFFKHSSFPRNVNYAKKHERQRVVKHW